MSKTKKTPNDVITLHIQVRKAQLDLLRKAADQVGLPVSAYVRTRALESVNRELLAVPTGGM